MSLTRRHLLSLLGCAVVAVSVPIRAVIATPEVQRAIAIFTGGTEPIGGGVRLKAPEISDNGGSVPVTVSADNAKRIALFAENNPNKQVAVFSFGRMARPVAATRIRLSESQRVIAVAETADGQFRSTLQKVVVTAGGCG